MDIAAWRDHDVLMRVRCEQCGWVVNPDPPFIFHSKTFSTRSKQGGEVKRTLWLCPDCSAEFDSDEGRDRFLQERLTERGGR